MKTHHNITVAGDIMFVNRIPFLITRSKNIKFGTVDNVPSTKIPILLASIKPVLSIYRKRSFRVRTFLMDNQFEPMRGTLAEWGVELNIVAANEHVPEIERYICTVKERTRDTYNSLHFTPPGKNNDRNGKEIHLLAECFPSHGWHIQNIKPQRGGDRTCPRLLQALHHTFWDILSDP